MQDFYCDFCASTKCILIDIFCNLSFSMRVRSECVCDSCVWAMSVRHLHIFESCQTMRKTSISSAANPWKRRGNKLFILQHFIFSFIYFFFDKNSIKFLQCVQVFRFGAMNANCIYCHLLHRHMWQWHGMHECKSQIYRIRISATNFDTIFRFDQINQNQFTMHCTSCTARLGLDMHEQQQKNHSVDENVNEQEFRIITSLIRGDGEQHFHSIKSWN